MQKVAVYNRKTKRRNSELANSVQPDLKKNGSFGQSLSTALKPDAITAGFRDPSFGHNRQYPVHSWVPWVAGFSAQFVNDC